MGCDKGKMCEKVDLNHHEQASAHLVERGISTLHKAGEGLPVLIQ